MNEMASAVQPLYLLADSQLLFWKRRGRLVLGEALDNLDRDTPPNAAYIGASNGDRPEFFDIFEAAVESVGVIDRRMIDSSFGSADHAFLDRADLIVLAGGDVRLGWNTFENSGMKEVILDRYMQGAVLVGISAGAVQLGRCGIVETTSGGSELIELFNLVHLVIDTHDEDARWTRLSRLVHSLGGSATGLGIPSGGGVIVHTDGTIEPVRRPAHEFRCEDSQVTHSLVCPDESATTD